MKLALVIAVISSISSSATAFAFGQSDIAGKSDVAGAVIPSDASLKNDAVTMKKDLEEAVTPAPTFSDETTPTISLTDQIYGTSDTSLVEKGLSTSPSSLDDAYNNSELQTEVSPATQQTDFVSATDLSELAGVTPVPSSPDDTYTETLPQTKMTPPDHSLAQQNGVASSPFDDSVAAAKLPLEQSIPDSPGAEVTPILSSPIVEEMVSPQLEVTPSPSRSSSGKSASPKTPCPALPQPSLDTTTSTEEIGQISSSVDPPGDGTKLTTPDEYISTDDVTPAPSTLSGEDTSTVSGKAPCPSLPVAGSSSLPTPAPSSIHDIDETSLSKTGKPPCPPLPQPSAGSDTLESAGSVEQQDAGIQVKQQSSTASGQIVPSLAAVATSILYVLY